MWQCTVCDAPGLMEYVVSPWPACEVTGESVYRFGGFECHGACEVMRVPVDVVRAVITVQATTLACDSGAGATWLSVRV